MWITNLDIVVIFKIYFSVLNQLKPAQQNVRLAHYNILVGY